jgi:predicted alpha/beta-fold hydrolase
LSKLQYPSVLLGLAITLLTLWYLYYRLFKSARVKLYYKHNALNDYIVKNTAEFRKVYSSTPYLVNGNLQTMFFEFKRRMIHCPFTIKYERQLVKLNDGGQLAIDWPIFPEIDKKLTNSSPVIAILSAMAGGRNDSYVNTLIEEAAKRGYKSALINHRGCSKTPLLVLPLLT